MTTAKFLMYSFKGGAGRTVTAANVAYILGCEMERRVLLVDLDIESAGSSVLFGIDSAVQEGKCWSVQDVLRGYHEPAPRYREHAGSDTRRSQREVIQMNLAAFEELIWPRMHCTVWPDAIDGIADRHRGFVKVLPAQVILRSDTEQKPSSFSALNAFEHLLDKIEDMVTAPELLLFDSASGQQETAQMGLAYCDVLVVFVRWTRQFITGTLRFLSEYICTERFCPRIQRVLLVPTAVPRTPPAGRLATELNDRRRRVEDTLFRINQRAGDFFGKAAAWVAMTDPVHECQSLKWDDRIFLMENTTAAHDQAVLDVLEDYRRLARTLVTEAGGLLGGTSVPRTPHG